MAEVLLDIRDLKIHYAVKNNKMNLQKKVVRAVDGVTFQVHEGETFGIVGESGCGKTTTGKSIVKIVTPTSGSIQYRGVDIYHMPSRQEDLAYRKKLQFIFQDPYSSLDPRFTVGHTIEEPMIIHKAGTAAQRRKRVMELLEEVGLKAEHYTRFPHEFSGGQRQRIGVARALALSPELIVCDEPVSALDVSIQAQILNLMKELQQSRSLTYIFISHNLSVVKHICQRVGVMYLGNFVEIANVNDLFDSPRHPYTIGLLDAIPIPDPEIPSLNAGIEGDVPSPMNPPDGCCFHTRCKYAVEQCKQVKPQLENCGEGHQVACHRADEIRQSKNTK